VCASVAATAAYVGVTTCNPNYSIAQLGTITRWTPVKNLTFSGEFLWSHLNQNYAGTFVTSGSYGTGAYTIGNQDTYQVFLRAQRNF
jgi:Porin subfamily